MSIGCTLSRIEVSFTLRATSWGVMNDGRSGRMWDEEEGVKVFEKLVRVWKWVFLWGEILSGSGLVLGGGT